MAKMDQVKFLSDVVIEGKLTSTSKGLTYKIPEGETYAICSGLGTCTDTDIVIASIYQGKPVTSIVTSAFEGCTSLTSITIPDSVTHIGDDVFSGCTSLKSINIPDSVTYIGDSAFYGCSSLESITIPDSVTSIGAYTFEWCLNLTIYCEAEFIPEGWHEDWNRESRPVVWGAALDFPAINDKLVGAGINGESAGITADKIKFDQDLIFTETFGKYSPDSTGTVTIPTKTNNMSLLDLFTKAYSEDKNPNITEPSATITFSGTGSFEVGTSTQPKVKFTANHLGEYQYGPDTTGASWTKLTYSGNGANEQTFTISGNNVPSTEYSIGSSVTVADDTNITVSAALHYSAATATPKTALGEDYEDGKFAASSVSDTASITGFRRMFFRTFSEITAITGTNIRPTTITSTNAPRAQSTTTTLSIPEGTKQVCIALPAGRTLGTVIPSQGLQVDIAGSFVPTTNVSIDGAAANTGANYTVYTLTAADGLSANTYKITIN